ncbi:Hpt domain-containing protein [Bulleidia sp. HCP3S3_F2]|uniref:Hpt domain-containing protein n=1 Tax=unclassified Bulleidia TaxID=2704656 RepID=UPI003F8A6582
MVNYVIKLVKKFESDQSYAELKQGLADKDVEKAFRAAHTLKGICLNLGFSQLTEDVVNITEILRAGKLEGTDELFSKIQTTYENTVAEIKKLD